jgi:dTDP-4-dehydrorhamnose reductase
MKRLDYLVTGANGQLGRSLLQRQRPAGLHASASAPATMPLARPAPSCAAVDEHRPRWRACTAVPVTNVDGCEQDPLQAYRINGLGTAWLAEACRGTAPALLRQHRLRVRRRGDDALPVDHPVAAAVGLWASKRLGEEAVLGHGRADFYVLRTSWVFGPGGKNFPKAILDRARSGQPLKRRHRPASVARPDADLADAMLDLCELRAPAASTTRRTKATARGTTSPVRVLRRPASAISSRSATSRRRSLKRPGPRPAWSVLDTQKLTAVRGASMPTSDAVALPRSRCRGGSRRRQQAILSLPSPRSLRS